MMTIDSLTIRRPDDWHVHLRDGAILAATVAYTARQFARAIVMPNLAVPVTTTALARAYRERILAALAPGLSFEPLMTVYLTDATDPDELVRGHAEQVVTAAKLYPANATTNSAAGVTDVRRIGTVFETMQRIGMPLLLHGEVTDPEVDVFDREARFIDQTLTWLVARFPALKIVLEHITTSEAVDFVTAAGPLVAATITPHHLEYNRNAMFVGGIRPHLYCLPVIKRDSHRLALRKAAVSGNPKFFLGTDSAPHARTAKESACGCAGIFNAPHALESYAKVFDEEDALERLAGFAAEYGPSFYGLATNCDEVVLRRAAQLVPATLPLADEVVVPMHAGATLPWTFVAG